MHIKLYFGESLLLSRLSEIPKTSFLVSCLAFYSLTSLYESIWSNSKFKFNALIVKLFKNHLCLLNLDRPKAKISIAYFVNNTWRYITANSDFIWASSQQNLSLGFPTKLDSNQSPQLQRLARKLKVQSKSRYDTFQWANNKSADQTVRMRRLVCAFVVRNPPKTGFLASSPIW